MRVAAIILFLCALQCGSGAEEQYCPREPSSYNGVSPETQSFITLMGGLDLLEDLEKLKLAINSRYTTVGLSSVDSIQDGYLELLAKYHELDVSCCAEVYTYIVKSAYYAHFSYTILMAEEEKCLLELKLNSSASCSPTAEDRKLAITNSLLLSVAELDSAIGKVYQIIK